MYNGSDDQRMLPGITGTARRTHAAGGAKERQACVPGKDSMDMGKSEFYLEVDRAQSFTV